MLSVPINKEEGECLLNIPTLCFNVRIFIRQQ